MKNQAYNPYLPSFEYIPDGEPYVFEGRVYLYGSHDQFNGQKFCANDYVCWSASVDDLGSWKYEGVVYQKQQDPLNLDGKRCLYAPDLQRGLDGRYYLYYALDLAGIMSVAVCDTPAGKFSFYGHVQYPDGSPVGQRGGDIFQFDPGVLVDDDGRVFLYSGFAPQETLPLNLLMQGRKYEGGYFMELAADMLTVIDGPKLLFPKVGHAAGTGFEGHEFFEASSIRKVGKRYYFIYSSIHGHELCYATSDRPDGEFHYGGTIISNGDIFMNGRCAKDQLNYTGNNHGSIVEIGGQWYVFYHRQTNKHQFSRQACAEPITINPNGSIRQVEMTSCGLNGGPLKGKGEYEARIACNLVSARGAVRYSDIRRQPLRGHLCFTQTGGDREEHGDQYIAEMSAGAVAGFKYFELQGLTRISVRVRGTGKGSLLVQTALGQPPITVIPVGPSKRFTQFSAPAQAPDGHAALYFQYQGTGQIDFLSFEIG
jgi:hypothetical protein